ncbi:right-handed parallel beta-helix repeat-containing protein [Curtobacterium sp. PhB136]|uniref:right-handed parallel beta-helix repeat-containing protein n=1 Tax=Curtobacterium sp. PhB136 TaxID=2485181 RepID=UPI00104FCBF3|nr:right-handed parallel beta-helix repeat-containing protein [Curtobacterium sp. PhB136]TCK65407.1 parallel beta helix pectate lyase-like protein [Curtobacterium sp. PhB136]
MARGELLPVSRRAALLGAASTVPGLVLAVASARAGASTVDAAPASVPVASASASEGVTHSDDVGAARLQDVLDAARQDAVVDITRAWSLSAPLVVARPMTLRFVGGALSTDRDIDLVLVRAPRVRVVDARLVGSGATHSGLGRGVHAVGTVGEPLTDVHVTGAEIRGFSHDGVLFDHCTRFSVTDCVITDVGYAGVLLFSCVGGSVLRNRVARVLQPSPYPNSYGIEAVRATSDGLAGAPRSSRITIADNHVSDVQQWEGIDTHGGEAISILRNRVDNCRVGIAVVPSKDEADATATKYAPIDCAVVDNLVTRSEDGPGSGIVVRGAGEVVGSEAERATGVVLRNTVTGYGDGDRDAGILVYLTRNLTIAHNRCDGGVRRGLSLYHSNERLAVIGNTVDGLRQQGTATSVAIDVRAGANDAVLLDNRYSADAGGRGGAVYGVMCRQAGNDLVLVANDWAATTSAVVATTGVVVRYRED